jgi:hypothetical protein
VSPARGELVALNLPDARATGVYSIVRKAKAPTRLGRRPPEINAATYTERNAAIYGQRKAGRTLRAIADDFGLSRDRIRGIECREERRELHPEEFELSVGAANVINNTLGLAPADYENDDLAEELKTLARLVAEAGRYAFVGKPNCGVKTLAEIEAWTGRYGFRS